MMDTKTRARLRGEAQALDATLQVGKSGITETLVKELKAQLEGRGLVKVRLLQSSTHDEGKDPVAERLAEESGAELVEVRGNTAVYWKRKR